jgi:hypothetical protein
VITYWAPLAVTVSVPSPKASTAKVAICVVPLVTTPVMNCGD